MAKSTHAQEVSTGTPDSYTDEEMRDPQPVIITRPMLGEVDRVVIAAPYEPVPRDQDDEEIEEEEPSVTEDGGDSTQSSQSESSDDDKPNQSRQQPAPTTDSHSTPTPTDSSGADSTDGDGPKTEPRPSANKGRQTPAKKAAPKKQTGARATIMRGAEDHEFDDFD